MHMSEAIREYQSFQETRGDSPNHRKECARILGALIERVGDLSLGEISPDQLRAFITEMRSRPGLKGRKQVSDFTLFAYHRVVNAFFNYLERQELLAANPMKRVPKPKVGSYLIQPFSEEQVKKLLAQPDVTTFAGLRDFTLMCFLLDTGCRISEALALTYTDLDCQHRLARLMGKGRKERQVPFGEHTLAWLERYLARRRESLDTDFVFVNQYGEQLTRNTVAQRIADYGDRAGLRGVRASAHTFRHTFGVCWLLGKGDYKGDAISLQRILGHSTPAMTQRYVHLVGQDFRKLHDRLSPADGIVAPPPSDRRRRLR